VSHRFPPANERGLNSDSRTCLSDVPLSHVVVIPDCCSLRTGRVPRVEREIMVVTKSAAPDTLPDSVSASFYRLSPFRRNSPNGRRISATIIAPTPLVAANL